jgi:predicted acyltransferase (DUF342 family)
MWRRSWRISNETSAIENGGQRRGAEKQRSQTGESEQASASMAGRNDRLASMNQHILHCTLRSRSFFVHQRHGAHGVRRRKSEKMK